MIPRNLQSRTLALSLTAVLGLCLPLRAAVLPEDRLEALYHSYDGGGVEITGPALQMRKQFGGNTSVSGKYYVDTISSASIDVVTSASPYAEERTEYGASVDYLHDQTTMSVGYTTSDENDFNAATASFGFSQDMFGNMTTVSMAYARGWDEVGMRDSTFSRETDRHRYRLGLSQVLTKNMVGELAFEGITDQGFLNNPYRQVRYVDDDSARPCGCSFQPEEYPSTRTSYAVSARSKYFLPYRAAVHVEYRYFSDTWGIDAHTLEAGYTHPWRARWVFDVTYRYYTQSAADFYRDTFTRENELTYRARDKELSTFSDHTLGVAASYTFLDKPWGVLDKGSVSLKYDHIMFDYADFRDARVDAAALDQPLYSFSADVFQLYLSLWY